MEFYMNNTTIQFQSSVPYSMEGMIDGEKSVKVATDSFVTLDLVPGVHTLRVAVPYQGNEIGVVEVDFEVKPEGQYTIIYKFTAMQMRGSLTVKERLGRDQETEVAKTSGAITRQGIGIQIIWFTALILVVIAILLIFFF